MATPWNSPNINATTAARSVRSNPTQGFFIAPGIGCGAQDAGLPVDRSSSLESCPGSNTLGMQKFLHLASIDMLSLFKLPLRGWQHIALASHPDV